MSRRPSVYDMTFLMNSLDGIGNQDYLSPLPDLCLFKVCSHLERSDLSQLGKTNLRMHSITNDRSLDKIKWKNGDLIIGTTKNGYGFKFIINYEEIPRKSNVTYQYEIVKTSSGFYERRKIRSLFAKTNKCNSIQFESQIHQWPVPEYLFKAITRILRQHQSRDILIEQLEFNSMLISNLDSSLHGQDVDKIECYKMRCSGITNDTRRSFAKLLKRSKSAYLTKSDEITSLINEDFLSEISESNLMNFECEYRPSRVYDHRFTPNDSIIARICRMRTLIATAMVLDANTAMTLILKRLAINQRGRWNFSVDNQISVNIVHQHLLASDYKRCISKWTVQGGLHHILEGKVDHKTTRISTWGHSVDGGIVYLVDVQFYDYFRTNKEEFIHDNY